MTKAEIVAKVAHGESLSRANLSGAYLSEAYLFGADLSGADLSGADLSGADLSEANLSRANLSRANLSRANLSGAYLSEANLSRANLSRADLSGAYLSEANLSGADLSEADLSEAYLSEANLSGAYLSEANLSGANLSRAKGMRPELSTSLYFLYDQIGPIRAYKLVTAAHRGPFNGGIRYDIGQSYVEMDANTDATVACAAGINLATLDWCLREWQPGYKILIAEFTAADIAAIPQGSDGKFRVRRCTIVGEKAVTGLIP